MKIRTAYHLAAIVLLALGCSKTELNVPQPSSPTYRLILSGDCQTKTSLGAESDGERPVLWKTGDMLGLFVREDGSALDGGQNILARLTDGTGTGAGYGLGSFVTDVPMSASKTYTLDIYYPYSSNAGSAETITHSIPSRQTQSAVSESRHYGMSGSFAYATATFSTPSDMSLYDNPVVEFTMSHKTSTVWLSVKSADSGLAGWKVKSVSLTAPDGVNLCGDVSYSPSSGAFALTGNGSPTVSLAVPGGAVLSTTEAADLYMVTFPAELAGKSVTLTYTLESSEAAEVKRLTHVRTIGDGSKALASGRIHRFTETLPSSDCDGWTYVTGAFDLSAEGTANCYIVSTPGIYSFDATVIGNGQQGILTPTDVTFFHTESATIAPAGTTLLWQTAKGLITDLSYADGRITFTKSADVEYGNALIAATDADGVILWSWHIWCTETGDLQTWVAPTGTYEAMDRNLGATFGATTNISGESQENLNRTVGMFYCWGRKDPFVGPAELLADRSSKTLATLYDIDGGTVSRPSKLAASKIIGESIVYAIQNPLMMLQIAKVSSGSKTSGDWFSDGAAAKGTGPSNRGYYLWGNPEGYNYKSSSKPSQVKTIYDPCPLGYTVPPMDMFTGMKISKYEANLGNLVIIDGGTSTAWLPLASHIVPTGTSNTWSGQSMGYYWMSSMSSENTYAGCNLNMDNNINAATNGLECGYGFQVRCIQEIR